MKYRNIKTNAVYQAMQFTYPPTQEFRRWLGDSLTNVRKARAFGAKAVATILNSESVSVMWASAWLANEGDWVIKHPSERVFYVLSPAAFSAQYVPAMPADEAGEIVTRLGMWLSAALDDPTTCKAFRDDILAWMNAGHPNAQSMTKPSKQEILTLSQGLIDSASDQQVLDFADALLNHVGVPASGAAASREKWDT